MDSVTLRDEQMEVLVAGSGSIGRRHMRNLRSLGIERIAACDPDPDRLSPMVEELEVIPFSDFQEALLKTRPRLVFVCSPPIFHVSQALAAVMSGADVFIEKPLSHSLDGVEELIQESEARKQVVQVGYNMRFHPGVQKTEELVRQGVIGRILWASVEVGQYLPDWRPWQDYRQSYTARRDLGGGIILDASHELEYTIHLLGAPVEIQCVAGKVSGLDVDVEDCATLLLRFAGGAQADVHMDFIQRCYSRSCKLVGETGSLVWDYPRNEVRIYRVDTGTWETLSYEFEPNDMYVDEIKHFLACVRERSQPAVDLAQSAYVLKVALAAKLAAAKGSREFIT